MSRTTIPYVNDGNGNLTVFVPYRAPMAIPRDHALYPHVLAAILAGNVDAVVQYADIPAGVAVASGGRVQIINGEVTYDCAPEGMPEDRRPLDHQVARRIGELLRAGHDCSGMLLYLEDLLKNPSARAVREQYRWLEHRHIPITADGCFLGYKRVTDEGYAFNTGPNSTYVRHADGTTTTYGPGQRVRYRVGDVAYVERNQVNDDFGLACSEGIHVGDISYVQGFNSDAADSQILICKVRPSNVVSVPSGEINKVRVCEVEFVDLYTAPMVAPLYDAAGTAPAAAAAPAPPEDEDEDEGEDEDDDLEDVSPTAHSYILLAGTCPRCQADLTDDDDALRLRVRSKAYAIGYVLANGQATGSVRHENFWEIEMSESNSDSLKDIDHVLAGEIDHVACGRCDADLGPLVAHYLGADRLGTLSGGAGATPVVATPTPAAPAAAPTLVERLAARWRNRGAKAN